MQSGPDCRGCAVELSVVQEFSRHHTPVLNGLALGQAVGLFNRHRDKAQPPGWYPIDESDILATSISSSSSDRLDQLRHRVAVIVEVSALPTEYFLLVP